MKAKSAVFVLVVLLLCLGQGCATAPRLSSQSLEAPPFGLLRGHWTGETVEYEFLANGRLIVYYIVYDGSTSNGHTSAEGFSPKFSIEDLEWKIDENRLFIRRGDKWSGGPFTRKPNGGLSYGEGSYEPVSRLMFFEEAVRFREMARESKTEYFDKPPARFPSE